MSEHFPAELFARLPGLLVPWFLREKRDLEWRNDPTPYRVWISEIMLQQTRVEVLTLDEGYLFTAALPDLQRGIAPLGPPAPVQPPLLGMGLVLPIIQWK